MKVARFRGKLDRNDASEANDSSEAESKYSKSQPVSTTAVEHFQSSSPILNQDAYLLIGLTLLCAFTRFYRLDKPNGKCGILLTRLECKN